MDPHWTLLRPDGHAMTPSEYPVSRVVRTGEPVIGMLLGVRAPNAQPVLRWLQVNATPVFKADGGLDFVVVDFSDITERRQLELELENERNKHRLMLRNASDGMCILDEHGCVVEASDQWGILIGYARDELLGMHVSRWEASLDARAIDGVLTSVIAGRERVQFETRHRRKDGSVVDVEVSAVPFEYDGRPLVFCLTRDVMQRKRAQAALEASRQSLEQQVQQRTAQLSQALLDAQAANRAKDLFLSSMSHELRTPLHAVLGYAQLLLSAPPDCLAPQQRGQARQIEASAEHLLSLVSDLLDLARIESGELDLVIQPVDIEANLGSVLASVEPMAAKAGVEVSARAQAAARWALADIVRIRQCLINLVSNGIKYNRPGGAVHVSARLYADGVVIDVDDTGRGMGPEQVAHLFERFNRLGMETTGVEGSGIGLVITRQLVERMNGRLSVVSRPGAGSTFSIWLPAAPPTSAPAAGPTPAPDPTAPDAPPSPAASRLDVLYIEDNPVNVTLMQAMAAMRPHVNLRVARSGAEGLASLGRERARLVLVDMNLGDCHGLELIPRMRAQCPDASRMVVAVSADASRDQIEHALANGFDRYLTKPLRLEALLALFDEVTPPGTAPLADAGPR